MQTVLVIPEHTPWNYSLAQKHKCSCNCHCAYHLGHTNDGKSGWKQKGHMPVLTFPTKELKPFPFTELQMKIGLKGKASAALSSINGSGSSGEAYQRDFNETHTNHCYEMKMQLPVRQSVRLPVRQINHSLPHLAMGVLPRNNIQV